MQTVFFLLPAVGKHLVNNRTENGEAALSSESPSDDKTSKTAESAESSS